MNDIVTQLRSYRTHLENLSSLPVHPDVPGISTGSIIRDTSQAADEIEQLRAIVRFLQKSKPDSEQD